MHCTESIFRTVRTASTRVGQASRRVAGTSRRLAAQRPSRVQLGAAAATAAAVAGLAVAVSGGSTQAGAADALNHATAHTAASHAPAKTTPAPAKTTPAPAKTTPAPAKTTPAPAKKAPAPAKKAPAKKAPAKHAPAGKPYEIFDSVTPSQLPAHRAVATYADGGYAASASQVAGHKTVLWIDTNGSDPRANALDVEPGDATPQLAATWTRARLNADPHLIARIYTMRSEWPAVKAAIAGLPAHMRNQVRYWIADPTGVPHMVPGSSATQWYWGHNYDITTASPNF
jgi:hypothetical protein